MDDWIETFLAYTDGLPTPPLFRLWSAISTVGGALERRVYASTRSGAVYPNLFTLLVASPGIGKSEAIKPVEDLWVSASSETGFFVAPNNMTKAALVDAVASADRKRVIGNGVIEYHSLLIAASEFGVLVPAHDTEFLSTVNLIYDNPRFYREQRRHFNGGEEISITNPQLNILAGVQPGYLATLLPDEAWSMGFTSRLIMIYAASRPVISLFAKRATSNQHLYDTLLQQIITFGTLIGEAEWMPDAAEELDRWYMSGMHPRPEHSKLAHYCERRILHIIKLCIISAISRTGKAVLTMSDLNRARDWLLEAEVLMPDIFREMVGRSDSSVLQDLHHFLWQTWSMPRNDKRPIHQGAIVNFLRNKVPSEKIMRVIDIAERANIIARVAGTSDMYVPRPKDEFGQIG